MYFDFVLHLLPLALVVEHSRGDNVEIAYLEYQHLNLRVLMLVVKLR